MKKQLILPLVESLVASYKGPSLGNVRILGVQHILETTHSMFQSLYRLGLKPENVSIIGKCYSTCKEVYDEMIADGIDVGQGSFSYSSHQSYDELFEEEIRNFLSTRTGSLNEYERVIILDDGGKCITAIMNSIESLPPLIAIEQTSSGYEAIKSKNLPFPVINVARSPLKLKLESPMIAQAAAERLYMRLKKKGPLPNKALIIGGGAIGQAMQKTLSSDMEVSVFDQNKELSNCKSNNLDELINHFPLIIGCTGKTSIPYTNHKLFQKNTTLVCASSSDREFDAVHLRRQIPANFSCFSDLEVNDLLLINSGFPVNFDGERENIEPELIQLTIALITAGILQAMERPSATGIIPVNAAFEAKIETEFLSTKRSS